MTMKELKAFVARAKGGGVRGTASIRKSRAKTARPANKGAKRPGKKGYREAAE